MSANRSQSEIRALREQLRALKREAKYNEAVLRRAQARELELLRAETPEALLERLVYWLGQSFSLPATSLVLRDPKHEIRHLLMATGVRFEDHPRVLFVDSLRATSPRYCALRRPWLGPFDAQVHAALFPGERGLASVALLPLRRRGRLAGSLNLGSDDSMRFTRELATDFLSHLSEVASVSLENAINRARLVLSGLTDVLTGWHNRRYLQTRLQEELARARRDRRPLACVLLDVDFFKSVNDEHGHLAGDRVLRQLTARVEELVRVSDVAARFGGEEFALLLPATDLAAAAGLAERVRAAVAGAPFDVGAGRSLPVTISAGVSWVIPASSDQDLAAVGEALLARADKALYAAKDAGRDRVESAE